MKHELTVVLNHFETSLCRWSTWYWHRWYRCACRRAPKWFLWSYIHWTYISVWSIQLTSNWPLPEENVRMFFRLSVWLAGLKFFLGALTGGMIRALMKPVQMPHVSLKLASMSIGRSMKELLCARERRRWWHTLPNVYVSEPFCPYLWLTSSSKIPNPYMAIFNVSEEALWTREPITKSNAGAFINTTKSKCKKRHSVILVANLKISVQPSPTKQ